MAEFSVSKLEDKMWKLHFVKIERKELVLYKRDVK
jgi:hypothetical protein